MDKKTKLSGLYVILDAEALAGRSLVDALKMAADGGARLFQYRDKRASMREAYTRGVELKKAAQAYGATLIVNDRCDLALAVEADGAHLGQDDLPIAHARALLGPDRIIGVSTHNTEQVSAAAGTSADYLGFGPIFPPGSKSDHDPVVGVDGLRRVRALTALPVFAIGGIGPDHITTVYEAGADGVAVISAVWRSGDISQAIRVMLMRIAEADRRAR